MNSQKPSDFNTQHFGEQLRESREKLKLTQEDVALKTGMSTNYYAMIERGEVNLTFKKIQNLVQVLKLKIKVS